MRRVLRPHGLCYVNFLAREDGEFGQGREVEPGTFVNAEDGKSTAHTYFTDEEGDRLFAGCELVRKEKRIIDKRFEGCMHRMSFIDYILQKPAGRMAGSAGDQRLRRGAVAFPPRSSHPLSQRQQAIDALEGFSAFAPYSLSSQVSTPLKNITGARSPSTGYQAARSSPRVTFQASNVPAGVVTSSCPDTRTSSRSATGPLS